jgi:hypothetical protein
MQRCGVDIPMNLERQTERERERERERENGRERFYIGLDDDII